jgi:hypothetical protein
MIAIVNRTEELSQGMGVYGQGRQIYTLQINNKVLAQFEHNFEDGLAQCLYQAYVTASRLKEGDLW